jgi:predicted PurR-regulated permease PerM
MRPIKLAQSSDAKSVTSSEALRYESPEAVDNDWASPGHVHALLLMTATGIGIYLCYKVAAPFLPAFAWALALAVLFTPLQVRLEKKLKWPNVAAALSVGVIGLIVVIPLTFAVRSLVLQAAQGAKLVESNIQTGEWRHALEKQPFLQPMAETIEKHLDLPGAINALSTWLSSIAMSLLKGSVFQVLEFCITFYLLFFLLRDRQMALKLLRALSPVSSVEISELFARVRDTIHATIYGTLFVASLQGFLGGIMFWWLGLPAPLLWGVVMALLAMIPMVGSLFVWLPAAMFLAIEGNWGRALILVLWGMMVVGTIDNLLVGNRLKMHTALAFISVVGGVLVFGPAGLVLGPVTLAVTQSLLDVWQKHRLLNQVLTNSAFVALKNSNGSYRSESEAISRFENEGGSLG